MTSTARRRLVGRFDVVHLPIGEQSHDRYLRAGLAQLDVFVCMLVFVSAYHAIVQR